MNGIAVKKVLVCSEQGFVGPKREKRGKNTPVTACWQFFIALKLAMLCLDPS